MDLCGTESLATQIPSKTSNQNCLVSILFLKNPPKYSLNSEMMTTGSLSQHYLAGRLSNEVMDAKEESELECVDS